MERIIKLATMTATFNMRLLITMDYEKGNHNGVKQINGIDWILDNQKND